MKRDINLLPVRKSNPKRTANIVVTSMVAFLYCLVLGLGILIPKSIINTANVLNNGLQNQINELQPKVDEYEELKLQLDYLKSSMQSAGAMDYSKYDAKDALKILETTCPSGIMIKSVMNTDMTMTLDCIADNNYLIAQFALELERSGYFSAVSISGSSPATAIVDETQQAEAGNVKQFVVYLVYDLSIEEPVEEGGEAQ